MNLKDKQKLKSIRENTAKVNKAVMPKPKMKNYSKIREKEKAGRTVRAVKALKEEKEKQKALKEYVKKLDSELNAKDNSELSVYISIQVGKTFYTLERAKYNTQEKIDAFIEKKRAQETERIEFTNQKLRKPSKQW